MKDFLENRAQGALDVLHAAERGPQAGLCCNQCGEVTLEWYRCSDCWISPTLCRTCLLETHKHNPFHFVEQWDTRRKFWRREPLTRIGVTVELGHEGRRCPYASATPRTLTVVTENGIHSMKMLFCECRDTDTDVKKPEATQLLRLGLWPASWEYPESAFQIGTLKVFSLLANEAHVSAYDYVESLRKKTDFISPGKVQVRREGTVSIP